MSNMDRALVALDNAAADLDAYAGDPGVSFLVARRLRQLRGELENFTARDLLRMERNTQ